MYIQWVCLNDFITIFVNSDINFCEMSLTYVIKCKHYITVPHFNAKTKYL